jgi:hypothetical protein
MSSSVFLLVRAILWGALQLLVLVGGIVLAATWWRRAPRAAALTMTGLGLMLLCELVNVGLRYWTTNGSLNGQAIMMVVTGMQILRSVGLGMVVAAVFAGRPGRAEERAFEVQKVHPVANV